VEHRLRFSERGTAAGLVDVAVVGPSGAAPGPAAPGATLQPALAAPQFADVYVAPQRAALWRAAWAMFRERPVLGFGPDAYRLTYGRFLGLDKWDHRVFANNLALELLATTGALGLIAFAVVVAVVTRRAWRLAVLARFPAGVDRAVAFAAIGALAAFLA